jgi:hypothetical protein
MVVRPGQHVSGDGRVYHPYLAQWGQYWDVCMLCARQHHGWRIWMSGIQGLHLGRNLPCSTSLQSCEASSQRNRRYDQGNSSIMRPHPKLLHQSLHHQQNGGDLCKVPGVHHHRLHPRSVAQRLLHGHRSQASKALRPPNRRMTATHNRRLFHRTHPNNRRSLSTRMHRETTMGPHRTGSSNSLNLLRRTDRVRGAMR